MAGEKGRLLIVDDNRTVTVTTALIFTQKGYEVRTAYSAEEALALIRDWQPSAAILDVFLPKMDGIALARLMRLACPDCRVVLMSGQDIAGDVFSDIPPDFPLMAKPVEPDLLIAVVSESLLAR